MPLQKTIIRFNPFNSEQMIPPPMKSQKRMKTLSLLGAVSLLTVPLTAVGQTVIFNDTFGSGSTLNGTSTPGGTAAASSTSYDAASTKTGSCSISSGLLREKLSSGTTAGYVELQAMFASTPVQLVNIGDSINLTITFTNSAGTLLAGGAGSVIDVGLYYSGGVAPVAGTLNAAGLGSGTTYATGYCQYWQGYVAQINASGSASTILTRPWQTVTTSVNNGVQDLLFSGAGTGLFKFPSGTQIGSSVTSAATLASGGVYTLSYTILLSATSTVSITNNLYDAGGNLVSSQGATTTGGYTYTNFSNLYDGLAIGLANKGTSLNPQMDISRITISTNYYYAPAITSLTNVTVIAGNNYTFKPTVTGNPTASYQWYVSTDGGATSNAISYGTGAALTLTNVQYALNGYQYTLVATNALGTNAATATLSVDVAPGITGLNNQAVYTLATATISPTVTGIPYPGLQWQYDGTNLVDGTDANGSVIAGSTTSTLTITGSVTNDSGTYSLIASNAAGIVTNSMNLLVTDTDVAPTISGPTNVMVIQGGNATFSAAASGAPVPVLQWLDQAGTPIDGATNTTLTLTNVQSSQNGYSYSLVASNTVGSVTNSAILTVAVPPVISAQPANAVVTNTQSASFTVMASGVPAVAYQWKKNGTAISSAANNTATNATLVISSASPSDMGSYSVTITDWAGTTNSVSATLTVNSLMAAAALSPANGQTGLCYDTPLSITFSQTPTLRTNGTIKIFNVTNSTTPVDVIDLSSNSTSGYQAHSAFSGDSYPFNYYPVVITGTTAAIYPHNGVMVSNQTYYVMISDGAFADANGAYFAGITTTNVWQFTTKTTGPVDPVNPVVNADGSADFVTVQGAVDSLAVNAAGALRVITIKNGTYFEIVNISSKTNVTLRGQSRLGTFIKYPNNLNITPNGTTHARMTFKVNANDIAIENLSVTNSTLQGGGQAEALMIESAAKRCIINNCEIDSRQDTILANVNSSQGYFYNSTVKGNFDFIWGGGNLYFDKCTILNITGTGSGQLTAARTDTSSTLSTNDPWLNPSGTYTANGMSFVGCSFLAESGLGAITLAGSNGTSNNLVSWSSCKFATNYVNPSSTLFNGNYLFWQDQKNTDLTGTNSVTFSVLTTIGVTNNDPRMLAATNIPAWFYGWTPALAPNIVGQPASQTVGGGQTVKFAVSATGIPDPACQWYKDGQLITGATATNYSITGAVRTNAGSYTVVVSNASGSVTSSVATLTYTNTAPSLTPATYTRNGLSHWQIAVSDLLTNATDVDGDALTLVGVGVSTNGITLTLTGGMVGYANANIVDDQFSFTVADGFGGTSSAVITLTAGSTSAIAGQVSNITAGSGTVGMTFTAAAGYRYNVQMSTNLIDWNTLWTTNAPQGGVFQFTNNDSATLPSAFYRLMYDDN
jgi:hypothetical protein